MTKSRFQSTQPLDYKGVLSNYQLFADPLKGYVEYEQDVFNGYQNFLYKRALFGLSVYSPEELSVMHKDKKKRIIRVHQHAQKVLNLWKQELVNGFVNQIFASMFHHSALAKDCVEKFGNEVDDSYISKIDFKSIGIDKSKIVSKLIQEKILPKNFYELA